eukprot:5972188-Prymnesium_polylepis.1
MALETTICVPATQGIPSSTGHAVLCAWYRVISDSEISVVVGSLTEVNLNCTYSDAGLRGGGGG